MGDLSALNLNADISITVTAMTLTVTAMTLTVKVMTFHDFSQKYIVSMDRKNGELTLNFDKNK